MVSSRARLFHDCLDDCRLIDMGALGSLFTWRTCAQGQPPLFKRLDGVVPDCNWWLKL